VDEVDFSILAAKSVFTDLINKCPPAEMCRDAFDRTAKTTVKMAMAAGGFGGETTQTERRKSTKAPRRRTNHKQASSKSSISHDFSVPQPASVKSEPSPALSSEFSGLDGESYAVLAPPLHDGRGRASQPGLTVQTHNAVLDVDMLVPSPVMGDGLTPTYYGSHNMGESSGATTPVAPYVTTSGFGDMQDPRSMDWLQLAGVYGEATRTQMDGFNDPFCWDGITHQLADGQFGWFFFGQPATNMAGTGFRSEA
jgi:hypothetical protein